MATIRQPDPVVLIAGLLSGRAEWLDAAGELLSAEYGQIDLASENWPFTFTDYYRPVMGDSLVRRFIAFAEPIAPDRLAGIKRHTNDLEEQLARRFDAVARPVNIDPGYIAPSKLILASAKNFAHRVYLGGGIFAELTLQYHNEGWQSLPWTFPDYASGLYDEFLTEVRARLMHKAPPEPKA